MNTDQQMTMNDMILVSVDDHIVEPANMFDKHIPAAYKDKAPYVVHTNGADNWVIEGRKLANMGLNGVAGRPREEYGVEPAGYADMRKGCWDVNARVDDMNANGVLGSINFPTFAGFAGNAFLTCKDKTATEVIIQAYNDWHVDEWCAAAPGRFIACGVLPLWDVELCVKEVKRLAAKGVRTVTFPDAPHLAGLPSLHTGYWTPLWKAMSDAGMVISSHIGSGRAAPIPSPEAPFDIWITTMPMSIATSAADWLYSPVFRDFPNLKIALSEGGIGWVPYFVERADFTYEHHRAWTNNNFGKDKPSERFYKHFITCFIDDDFGLANIDKMNSRGVTWECDYPHSDCTWPNAPEYAWKGIKHLPKNQIDEITHLNVMREFNYDPFTTLGRENCTVGALRKAAAHVDTSPTHGLGGYNPARRDGSQVTTAEVFALFAEQAV